MFECEFDVGKIEELIGFCVSETCKLNKSVVAAGHPFGRVGELASNVGIRLVGLNARVQVDYEVALDGAHGANGRRRLEVSYGVSERRVEWPVEVAHELAVVEIAFCEQQRAVFAQLGVQVGRDLLHRVEAMRQSPELVRRLDEHEPIGAHVAVQALHEASRAERVVAAKQLQQVVEVVACHVAHEPRVGLAVQTDRVDAVVAQQEVAQNEVGRELNGDVVERDVDAHRLAAASSQCAQIRPQLRDVIAHDIASLGIEQLEQIIHLGTRVVAARQRKIVLVRPQRALRELLAYRHLYRWLIENFEKFEWSRSTDLEYDAKTGGKQGGIVALFCLIIERTEMLNKRRNALSVHCVRVELGLLVGVVIFDARLTEQHRLADSSIHVTLDVEPKIDKNIYGHILFIFKKDRFVYHGALNQEQLSMPMRSMS